MTVGDQTELAPTTLAPDSSLAYSDESPVLDYDDTVKASRRRVALIATGILVVAGVVAGAVLMSGTHRAPPPPVVVAQPPVQVDAPPNLLDRQFMDRLHELKVPADDWRYYVDWAQRMCKIVREGEPPGAFGLNVVQQVVRNTEPTWTTPQILNFAATIYNSYCPEMWGPTEEELAAMPPEQRFIARMGSRSGLMPPKNPESIVASGKLVCTQLRAGRARAAIVEDIESQSKWTADQSEAMVGVSVEVFCPEPG
jgi:hypothetical protein